jgi:hypothetical protein
MSPPLSIDVLIRPLRDSRPALIPSVRPRDATRVIRIRSLYLFANAPWQANRFAGSNPVGSPLFPKGKSGRNDWIDCVPSGRIPAAWLGFARFMRALRAVAGEPLRWFKSSREGDHLCQRQKWSERLDSNQRPPHPQCGALPDCATSRHFHRSNDRRGEFERVFHFRKCLVLQKNGEGGQTF